MNPKHLLEAMNDIDYSMVEEVENMMNRQKSRIPRGKKTVLIAAAVAVLLCITAGAAGLLWVKPEVQIEEDAHTLLLNNGYLTLPEASLQAIHEAYTSERMSTQHAFETVEEWQAFFGVPLAVSNYLSPYGTIETLVTVYETDVGNELGMMLSSVKLEKTQERNGIMERVWIGNLMVMALLDDDDGAVGSYKHPISDGMNAEILQEFITDAGIPCVISKLTNEGDGHSVRLFLCYGYESVLYEFELLAHSAEEEIEYLEYLRTYADTIQLLPNME